MGNDLNNYFVTFKIFKDEVQVHEMETPVSMLQIVFGKWVYPESPYTVHIVDSTGNFRFSSECFNR